MWWCLCIRFPIVAQRIWCKVQFYFPNLCMIPKCHRNCACSEQECQHTVTKWPEASKKILLDCTYHISWRYVWYVLSCFMKIWLVRTELFGTYWVVSCVQADGQSSSGYSAGLQIQVRRHFGILQYKTPAICLFLYVNC